MIDKWANNCTHESGVACIDNTQLKKKCLDGLDFVPWVVLTINYLPGGGGGVGGSVRARYVPEGAASNEKETTKNGSIADKQHKRRHKKCEPATFETFCCLIDRQLGIHYRPFFVSFDQIERKSTLLFYLPAYKTL